MTRHASDIMEIVFIFTFAQGEYILKVIPPQGWSFGKLYNFIILYNECNVIFVSEPSELELVVDGKTDPCSQEENIVFTFSGFPVFGQVLCLLAHSKNVLFCSFQVTSKGLKTGPAGVTVQLKTRGVIVSQ